MMYFSLCFIPQRWGTRHAICDWSSHQATDLTLWSQPSRRSGINTNEIVFNLTVVQIHLVGVWVWVTLAESKSKSQVAWWDSEPHHLGRVRVSRLLKVLSHLVGVKVWVTLAESKSKSRVAWCNSEPQSNVTWVESKSESQVTQTKFNSWDT